MAMVVDRQQRGTETRARGWVGVELEGNKNMARTYEDQKISQKINIIIYIKT